MRYRLLTLLLLFAGWTGCGTTKWSDTSRTATEQLLISDSVDRAVSQLDFRAVAGKKVYLDDAYIKNATDTAYLVSSLRQHILASGAVLREKREEADYVVEVRAGAVGTDRHDVLFGIPQTTLPMIASTSASSYTIPEIAFAKRTDQRAVTKVAVFAYNRQTGRPIWQSGVIPVESKAKAFWIVGAGPFQRGSIYQGTKFAGSRLNIPLVDPMGAHDAEHPAVSVAEQAYFSEPREDQKQRFPVQAATPTKGKNDASPASSSSVIQASHNNVSGPGGVGAPAAASSPKGDTRAVRLPLVTAIPDTAPTATPSQRLEPAASVPSGAEAPLPNYPSTDQLGPYPSVDPLPFYRR